MEAELTETDSRPGNLEISEDASVDESIPIDIRKERNTKSYKATMSKDIETLTLIKLEQNYIQINGGQSMRL